MLRAGWPKSHGSSLKRVPKCTSRCPHKCNEAAYVVDEEALNEPPSPNGKATQRASPKPPRICAVLFDRDETIVLDVPFNGDPDRVQPAPNARELLDRLRAAGLPLAVVSNQSGIGRGYITAEQADAVNRRV